MVLGMKLSVIILAILLLASMAGAAVAQAPGASAAPVLKDLDSLSYKVDDLNGRVSSELTDLNIAVNKTGDKNASSVIAMVASRGKADADAYQAELTSMEKGLWTVQRTYDPGKFSNKDATAIESRMSYIQNRLDDTRNKISDMRIAADRIGRTA
jgi:hypothetical protein